MRMNRLNEDEQKVKNIIQKIRVSRDPNVQLVHPLLQALHIFHIYDLERALTSLDARVREAALKKIEHYLPDLICKDSQKQKAGILALEHHFERIKMLDEDA
jgi:hypothetical protein